MRTPTASRASRRLIAVATTATAVAGILIGSAVSTSSAALAAPPTVPAGCGGGVISNPSAETGSQPPTGYKVTAGSLVAQGGYQVDGRQYAWVAPSSQGTVATAYQDQPAMAGNVYDLTFWGGTHAPNLSHTTGVRFLSGSGAVLLERVQQVDHDVDGNGKLQRYDMGSVVAPAGTATVRFFATANGDYNKFDCVYLRNSGYTVLKEVQDPASGQWLDADADAGTAGSNDAKPAELQAGSTAQYRITVTNTGTTALTNIAVADPWCDSPPSSAPISLAAGAKTVLTCSHAGVTVADSGHINTVTVSGATYSGSNTDGFTVPSKTERANITVKPLPGQNKLGDYVWIDNNRNGLQDAGEPGVAGVTVTLNKPDGSTATATTATNGKYLFDALVDGDYSVCFNLANLPAAVSGFQPTKKDAGDDAADSDADLATGCTPTTALGPDKREDLTLDLGLVEPTNRLGDYVWIDANRDGLQTDGEAPVPGVTVILQNAGGTEVSRQTTDAGGKYLFDNLPNGTYKVCFDLNALPAAVADYTLTTPNAGDDVADSDADPATGCTETTTLGPNKREDLTLDAGLVSPLNRLGDYVWIDANKDGLQTDGETPVEAVTAILQKDDGTEVARTTTDAAGKYIFEDLPDGTYKVCFDTGALPAAVADYLLTTPNAGDDAMDSDADPATGCTATTTLGVGKREDLTLDAGLVSPLNRLGDYVWIDANRNGVQDTGETPVPDVTAILQKEDGTELARTTTGPDGRYSFADLPDGAYKVCFDTGALPAAVADYLLATPNAGDDAMDSDADPATGCTHVTTLGTGNRADQSLDAGLVSPLNRLGDYVWIDANKDGLQTDGETPVEGVTAILQKDDGSEVARTTTDAAGKYIFGDLPDGTYKVCFDKANLPAAVADYQLTSVNAGDDAMDSDADPATGCTATTTLGVGKREDLTLDAGLITPVNRLGDYVWIDANKDGLQTDRELPVEGVTAILQREDGTEVNRTTTDAAGKYLFENLPDGTYKVCFDKGNLPAAVADYQLTSVNAGDDAMDSDADPATGCTTTTALGVGKREDLTLDAGLVSPLNRLGDYVWIDANKDGLQTDGETPVQGVTAILQKDDGTEVARTTTDAAGKYLFEDLPDGTYKVCFDKGNLPAAVADYQLTSANAGDDAADSDADPATGCTATTTLGVGKREDLTLDAGLITPVNRLGDYVWIDANKDGLQTEGETPVQGVTAILQKNDGTEVARTTTDAAGKYLFEDLPNGTYKVCFDKAKLPAAVADYQLTVVNAGDDAADSDADPVTGCTEVTTLGVGEREDLSLDAGLVSPANRLGDYVWVDADRNGLQDTGETPVQGVTAILRKADGSEVSRTTTDAAGKYLFDNLPDGSYKVCFDKITLPAQYAEYQLTKPNVSGADDGKDSDADLATWCTDPVKLGVNSREILTLDAGLTPPVNRIGDLVWADQNRNGLQDPGEPVVPGVPVVLRDANGKEITRTTTGPEGKYLFDGIPDGTFKVCFEVSKAPAPFATYGYTTRASGNDRTKDSDVNPDTGCTEPVTVGPGKREDLTLDAGLTGGYGGYTGHGPNPTEPEESALAVTGKALLGPLGLGLVTVVAGLILIAATLRRRRDNDSA